MDLENKNNHAIVNRMANSEKAEAILKVINEYRVYAQWFETLPTWDILQYLSRLENEVMEKYNKEVFDWERDKLKNEYYYLTGKRPFGAWTNEEIQRKIEEYRQWGAISEETLESKKARWKKAMQK